MTEAHQHEHEHEHEHSDLARLEAIRDQGVHRVSDIEGPFSLHVLGVGEAGAGVIAQLLSSRPDGFLDDEKVRFTALAVDLDDAPLKQVRDAAGGLPADRAQVRTLAMPVPTRNELLGNLNRYREFLKMEYPRYYWNPNYEPWLPGDIEMPRAGDHFPRAVAKAIYGVEYYQGGEIAKELDAFAASVDASESTPIVVVVFGLGGGTGSGMVVEMARHLSSIKLGRRPWVVGIGILPCEGDREEIFDGRLFPVINELDCMIDAEKNKGVMAVWGDLYKNPFTGGFFAVPQNEVHAITKDLASTHRYVDEGIANFIARDNSLHLYETLKLLNWLGVSAETWHPAIRGEMSDRWINMLSVRRPGDVDSLARVDLRDGFATEYAEARVFGKKGAPSESKVAKAITSQVKTTIEPGVIAFDSGDAGAVTLVVPRATKLDLELFVPSRDAYDKLGWDEKLIRHAWLLDLGVLLCEPSIRFEGMGGECIWGCACWVVVPHAAIRGEVPEPAVSV
ncbi:MAG: tubulin-like doman-containing protein [Solirubrobacteraceae bacterium]